MRVLLQVIGRILPETHMVAVMRGIVLRDAGPGEMFATSARWLRSRRSWCGPASAASAR
jgi:hypothetical protein